MTQASEGGEPPGQAAASLAIASAEPGVGRDVLAPAERAGVAAVLGVLPVGHLLFLGFRFHRRLRSQPDTHYAELITWTVESQDKTRCKCLIGSMLR